MAQTEVPVDLYVAAYDDEDAAGQDWISIKDLASEKVVDIEALLLVSRDDEGQIHVQDNAHQAGVGAALGAVGGAVVGLIFPPSLIATALVGAGLGAGSGAVVDQVQKHKIRADVEATLPRGSSAIVAVIEERWVAEVAKTLAQAERAEHHHAHGEAWIESGQV